MKIAPTVMFEFMIRDKPVAVVPPRAPVQVENTHGDDDAACKLTIVLAGTVRVAGRVAHTPDPTRYSMVPVPVIVPSVSV